MLTRRPVILFILSDQHAQEVSGCYGGAEELTPHLDSLAADGIVFDHAYWPRLSVARAGCRCSPSASRTRTSAGSIQIS